MYASQLGKILYSTLGSGDYFKPSNYIPIGSGMYAPTLKSFGNKLRAYSPEGVWDLYGDNANNFQLVKISERGLRSGLSNRNESAPENVVNDQFFITNDGIESSRYLEGESGNSVPYSYPIFRDGTEIGSTPVMKQKDGRLYLFNNTGFNLANPTKVYVLDTKRTAENRKPAWTRFTLPRTVDCAYYADGKMYLGIGGIVIRMMVSQASDNEDVIPPVTSPYVTTQRLVQGDIERPKTYYKVRARVTVSGIGNIKIGVGYE